MAKQNHRLVLRKAGNTIGPLQITGPTESFSAGVQDISVIGIGLIGNAAYAIGSIFTIETGPEGRRLRERLTAELCHATRLNDGRWLLGCVLSRPLTVDDFEILS
jgi:hypothetical protein